MHRRPDCAGIVEKGHNLSIDGGYGARGHDPMRTADEIHALVTWHSPTPSDALNAVRLRPFRTGENALLKPAPGPALTT